MRKFVDMLSKIEFAMVTVFMSVMTIAISAATFTRFTNLFVIQWAEELSRYSMAWLVFVGIAIGAKDNKLYTVENFIRLFPKSTRRPFFIFRTLYIEVFCVFMIWLSLKLISSIISMGQITPALQIPMWVAYACIPIGFILLSIHTIDHAIRVKWGVEIDETELDIEKYV